MNGYDLDSNLSRIWSSSTVIFARRVKNIRNPRYICGPIRTSSMTSWRRYSRRLSATS